MLELQFTRTRHTLSILQEKLSKFKTPENEKKKKLMKCVQNRRCTSSMYDQSLCEV